MDLATLAAIAGGANADAVACAAREADWRALRWTAEKLVLHAAQNPKVTANAYALAATQKAATRLQKIAANDDYHFYLQDNDKRRNNGDLDFRFVYLFV